MTRKIVCIYKYIYKNISFCLKTKTMEIHTQCNRCRLMIYKFKKFLSLVEVAVSKIWNGKERERERNVREKDAKEITKTTKKPGSSKMPIDCYYLPPSPPCRTIILLAKALGIHFNFKIVNVLKREHLTPEFLQVFQFTLVLFSRLVLLDLVLLACKYCSICTIGIL